MANLKHIENDAMFEDELKKAGTKLIIIDFFATWCGPCKAIAPQFTHLASQYRHVLFWKVDVDKCRNTSVKYSIRAMPTFVILKNNIPLQTLQGGSPSNISIIESKIREHAATSQDGEGNDTTECLVPGYIILNEFLTKNSCECLNSADKHPFTNCFKDDKTFLESDCDEQLILNLIFSQPIKLHSIVVKGPPENGPKHIKLFMNQTRTLDFDQAASWEPVQTIEVTAKDLAEGLPIPLKLVKFQNVQNLSVFVQDNQGDSETTQLNYLQFIGLPMSHTNMADFKRVAGNKGEAHVGM